MLRLNAFTSYPVQVVSIDPAKAEEIASLVAVYYERLRAADMPPDLVADLTRAWQAAYLANHGVTTIAVE